MKKILLVVLSCSLFMSCSDFDEDININPNIPSEASGTQLIANAQLYLPGLSSSPQGEFLAQYLAETQYVGVSLYPEESTSFYGWYQGPLMNLQSVLNSEEDLSATEGPVANQIAVAKILKAYFYWNMTDRWGAIPYSEGLQGADNYTPAYDSQEAIYTNLFQILEEANNSIVSGSISNDLIYDGDMSKWKKLGNTIRLLMALRLSEVDPEWGSQEFNAALSAGIMESNDDNLLFQHLADANNQSYWYGQVVASNREWWALTTSLVEDMEPVNDPRLAVYGNPARESGEYVGMDYGDTENLGTEEYSLLGSDIFAQDAPVYLVTYAQALFAIAEAAERGWVTEDAETYYNMAVENSIEQWTGSTEGADEFLSRPEIAYDAAAPIESIANQRWVHLFMNGYEAWSEWRRTGFPDDLTEPEGRPIPTRLSYPDNEAFNNADNYENALQTYLGGEDNIYGMVWWDV
ncbi:SusD/RagB family nutrient-binding outer membrane lipoprotein [Salinimicrobium sp. GXAS 041]|uniref:SusD/RagB family nutrient-binding outer membrane lipoprotein n=1 Tax=Salinimicrobium sp. GXAS 041 TaxID=3400806 RepID=UPI003C7438E0